MNDNLHLDFFRLVIFSKTKEDKIEAYHRVIDTAFKILNPVHLKIAGNMRTEQNQDAMILFQMAVSKSLAIISLIDGVQYKNRTTGASKTILDPTSIAAITRTQFEAFSTFHNIYNSNSNQDVIDLLHDIWVISGLKERQKGIEPSRTEFKLIAEKEKIIIDKLLIRIRNNSIFQSEAKEKQDKILEWIDKRKFEVAYRNSKLVLLSQKDMYVNAGVNNDFENQYSILSCFVHPSYISVLQFGQMFEKDFNEEHALTFLNISRIIVSMLIVEYCNYFPIAKEEFEKLPKLDQLLVYIDNKTFRSKNSFSIEVWKELEQELQSLLKLRK